MGVVLRVAALLGGLLLGVLALDDLGAVRFLAAFADTDAADVTVALGYVLVATLFGGAMLSLPAPRAAGIVFIIAGLIGIFVGSSTAWGNALVWGGGAVILAILCFIAHRIKRGKERRVRERELREPPHRQPHPRARRRRRQLRDHPGHAVGSGLFHRLHARHADDRPGAAEGDGA